MLKSWTLALIWWVTGFLLGELLFIPVKVTAQNANETVKVFLDCSRCDESHIRTELTFVDYVRDPQQADVHVFITSSYTVLSGRQYELSFIGLGSRVGSELNLTRVLSQDASGEETRAVLNEALRLGLAPFLGYLDAADEFSLVYGEGGRPEADEILVSDPWRHWTFNLYGGDFELDRESNRTVFDSRWGFYADHRSEDWKIRFRPYFNYDLVRIQR
ncbi:MAG: hypothetical protein F4058_00940, partial [Rhodothermaceae bacterium]|nr:hypothetical protein [Rhodothermaceae bacterium]